MRRISSAVPLFAILLAGCTVRPTSTGELSRGQYLVENVSMCGECHTPRNEQGELDRTRPLQGAILEFRPKRAMPDWAEEAPGIAGLKRMGDSAAIRLLEKGVMPNGKPARPPMPQYRMSYEDAAAIADYLIALVSGTGDGK
jgi:mono/diheme cytochrome c family protein